MLPVRVLHSSGSQFFGYGPNSREIEAMTSMHKKGTEPAGPVRVFGHTWEQDRGAYMWDGCVYLTWRMLD